MRELGPREEITDLSSSLSLVSFYIEKINKQTDTEKSPQCLPGISETLKILAFMFRFEVCLRLIFFFESKSFYFNPF